ncbi:type 1 glutamine amidotransferase [Saccharomonospora sp. CUA-673]|uniref:type 1 glutamine amidotransferase n=1 Tax=Saccharomonospora sp. CUA-673 TaxID=1904969 RepID=UPI002100BE14|nr:type 1 glutamine amidotransferase [Saccharomonospora sp. CUA-673]
MTTSTEPTRILVLQPEENVPLGTLGDWLQETGATLDIVRAGIDDIPAGADGYDAVVCLGGGMGPLDDDQHPWLPAIRELLASCTAAEVPTLGVCLGGQLLGAATGGTIARGSAGPEAGPALVSKKDAAWTDPLFADTPLMPDVLEFHRDVVEQLPPEATLLASSPKYPNQAFRIGRYAYGLQFHIETTPEIVNDWVARSPDVAAAADDGAFDPDRLERAHRDFAEVWRPFTHRFVELVRGERPPVQEPKRRLPLL